jgi:ubiquinone/menaquinone biosynthesis C-methylase UbiE/uncharacterized protein YbaR (Trm112 family)
MEQSYSKYYCCPQCKQNLSIETIEEKAAPSTGASEDSKSIKTGILLCANCRVWYPILNYVPVFYIFFLEEIHGLFAREHQDTLGQFSEYSPPKGAAEKGELRTLQSFSQQWKSNSNSNSNLNFIHTFEEQKAIAKDVYLLWHDNPPKEVQTILDVGCGMGIEARALQSISANAKVFGVDFNTGLLTIGEEVDINPNVTICMASLFHLPFVNQSFDLVYSHGVLHHTYSTHKAFETISEYVKSGGFLQIHIYAHEDMFGRSNFPIFSRIMFGFEMVARPILSRLPRVLQRLVISLLAFCTHPLFLIAHSDKKAGEHRFKFNDTRFVLYDWLTPPFAYKHSFNEVFEWFEGLNFTYTPHSPSAYRRITNKPHHGIGILGKRLTD